MHDGGDGIEEGEGVLAGQAADRLGQGRGGEGAGRHDRGTPFGRRQARDLAALEADQRLGREAPGDLLGKAVAIDGQRPAGRQLMGVGRRQDQGAAAAHLLMQQADGIVHGIVGAEGVRADELRQTIGLMGLGAAPGPHLMQHHGDPGPGQLPGRLAAGEPAAHHMNRGPIARIVLHRTNR